MTNDPDKTSAVKWICPRCNTRFTEQVERCPYDNKRPIVDLTGTVFGERYTVRELIGTGGMGSSVWKAWQSSTERTVAIKVLPPAAESAAARFTRGARIASKLNHPNITVVHDYGRTADNKLFLVMELLRGQTLHGVLRGTRGLPLLRTLHITDQILRALEHAHKKKVVHRDLKPGNLFLVDNNDDEDFLKVLDFGIAKYVEEHDGSEDGSSHHLEVTHEQQICGTPHYMAPEQVGMGTVDLRADLYALGVVTFRVLTGRLPFEGKSHHELFRQHLTEAPPPISTVRPDLDVPPELEELIMRSLAKNPEDRFGTASEMRAALRVVWRAAGGMVGDPEESMASMSMSLSMAGPVGIATPTPTPALAALTGADEPPPETRSKRTALMIGTGLAALLIAGWFAFAPDHQSAASGPDPAAQDTPQPVPMPAGSPPPVEPAIEPAKSAHTTAAKPIYATVHMKSSPTGAKVRWSGQTIGNTPAEFRLPTGMQTVSLSLTGYETEFVRIDLVGATAKDVVTMNVSLERSAGEADPAVAAPSAKPEPESEREEPSKPNHASRTARSSRRGPSTKKPKPAEPATAHVEPAPTPTRSRRIQLLDDGSSPAPRRPAAAPRRNVTVQLLDDDGAAPERRSPPPATGNPVKVDLLD